MQNTQPTAITMRRLRNLHFMNCCRKLLAADAGQFDSALRLAKTAANSEAPLYYVTFPYAHRVMRRYFAKGELPGRTERRIAMWNEIMERVKIRMACSGDSDTEALSYVLQQSASSFFLEPSSAERLYGRMLSLRRRKRHFNKHFNNNNLQTV